MALTDKKQFSQSQLINSLHLKSNLLLGTTLLSQKLTRSTKFTSIKTRIDERNNQQTVSKFTTPNNITTVKQIGNQINLLMKQIKVHQENESKLPRQVKNLTEILKGLNLKESPHTTKSSVDSKLDFRCY